MSAIPATAGAPRAGWLFRLKQRLRDGARDALAPLVRGMVWAGVKPDMLTLAGCALSAAAALAFFEGAFRWGSLVLALSGLCDILDGQLARALAIESRFGAFLDSTLDRLGEALVLAGIAGFYMVHLLDLIHDPGLLLSELQRGLEPGTWARVSLIAVLALVGAFLVSYTRARAEGLGLECKVGLAERPERMIAIMVGGAFGVGRVMPAVLLLLTVLCFVTAAQRVAYVWRNTRDAGPADSGGA